MIYLEIERKDSFNLNEGWYSATLSDVRKDSKGRLRLLWDIDSSKSPKFNYRAARTYDDYSREELQEQLEEWLGPEFDSLASDGRFDLQSLIGRKADIKIAHLRDRKHKEPFCLIERVRPVGLMVSDQ